MDADLQLALAPNSYVVFFSVTAFSLNWSKGLHQVRSGKDDGLPVGFGESPATSSQWYAWAWRSQDDAHKTAYLRAKQVLRLCCKSLRGL